ncbi:MAG: GDSL-type esterase/lipase family protein [Ferruginibacter sp.]
MKSLFLYFTLFILPNFSFGQVNWDDEQSKNWPPGFYKIEISSSADSTLQPSILYKSSKPGRPLIVSLHTWSGDYAQADSISWDIKERDWNYIHPHFRGPNWTPDACGSKLVIDDIEDAINYAIKVTGANPNEVHVVGTSGGGHATMLCYMKLTYPIKSFSAWVGISNLEDWYFESVGRNQQYAKDLLKTTGDTIQLNVAEARIRSPFYALTPVRNSNLYLYAGIHDGYLGSVPVSQTLKFYNKIVSDLYPGNKESLVSADDMIEILSKRNYQLKDFNMHIGDRKLHYYKKKNNISVAIFEGKHEQIVKTVLPLLPVNTSKPDTIFNILCIGDSNGELPGGWPTQLRYLLPFSNILNKCKSGNTIGLDNNGDPGLNELKNINNHLIQGSKAVSGMPLDYIIIMLGTNDCKTILKSNPAQITKNLDILLQKIEQSGIVYKKIILVSPPPVTVAANAEEKYKGALNKLSSLRKSFENLSKNHRFNFVDAYSLFEMDFPEFTTDGVHLSTLAQQKLARIITEAINN